MAALTSPSLSFDAELLLRAQDVRAAIFDVDGVLTDGRVYIGEHGEVFKAFSTLDGHGLKLLALAGIEPLVITGRDSPAVRRRVADLGLRHAAYGVSDKLAAARQLLDALRLDWPQVAVIGDDWPDLPLLVRAAFACAPPNAHAEARAVAHHVTAAAGGHGAAREFCDLLLCAGGHYARALQEHLTTLDGGAADAREPVVERPAGRRAGAALRSLLDTLSAYLPLLLMGLLALGTWWLVKNTPQPAGAAAESPLRHVPDYTMNTFNVQRFTVDGLLRAQIEGDVLRHYPDTDTLEIDNARILTIAPDSVTRAVARLAISNADASEVQLVGGAHVVRQPGTVPWTTAAGPLDVPTSSNPAAASAPAVDTLDFRGEFLHAFQHSERLRSHLPVVVTRGGTQLRADSMDYDNLDRVLNLKGRVRASFASSPAAPSPRRPPAAR